MTNKQGECCVHWIQSVGCSCGGFCHTKECNCALLGKASWHARDNPHSVGRKWECPVHGKMETNHLLHTEKQQGCVWCYPKKSEVDNRLTTENWEGKFDKLCNDITDTSRVAVYGKTKIAEFITSLLTSEREKAYQEGFTVTKRTYEAIQEESRIAALTEVQGVIDGLKKMTFVWSGQKKTQDLEKIHYNLALSDLSIKLEELKKKVL